MIKIKDGIIFEEENNKIAVSEEKNNIFRKNSIEDFASLLASKRFAPGGGGVAGLFAVQGFALISMVCNLTIGKKKFADFEEELMKIREDALKKSDRLLDLIELDEEFFAPLSKAYALPNSTDEEKETRKEVMKEALVTACLAPLEIVKISYDGIDTLLRLKDISSILVLSDVGVAGEAFNSAIKSGLFNVYTNVKVLEECENKKIIQDFVASIDKDYEEKYNIVRDYVLEELK